MFARLTLLGLLLASTGIPADSGGTTIEQWKARFLLLNARGSQAKFILDFDGKEISPFGFLAVFQKGVLAEVCNLFHVLHPELGNIAITAGHCTTKVPPREATFLLTYYDSRTDRQVTTPLQSAKTLPYPTTPDVQADFSYFAVPQEMINRWDAIAYRRSATPQEGKGSFTLWAYQFRSRNDPRYPEDRSKLHPRAVLHKRTASGMYKKGPQIATELVDDKGEIRFGLRFGLTLSERGFEADQNEALFLEKLAWEPGDSGGLVTDSDNHPVGVIVTGESAVTFSNRWNDKLKTEFFTKATKELGQAPPKSPLSFWFLGNFATPASFQLNEDRKFYAVALLLDAFLAD